MKRLSHHLHHIVTNEKGTMLPYAVAGIFIIALIGYMLIGYLGDGCNNNNKTKTAADKAALAAEEARGQKHEADYTKALTSTSQPEFRCHFGRTLALTKGRSAMNTAR